MVFIGNNSTIRAVLQRMERLFQSEYPPDRVLILGETGTGKEVLARFMHQTLCPKNSMPFVPFNCANLHPSLADDQLFGHVRGAYTGAHERSPSLFQKAAGGTLFFDEIGELDTSLQGKLLRVLEYGTFFPLGGRREETNRAKCIVFATNHTQRQLLDDGVIRRDLWYRIAGLIIEIPPLRERLDDVPLLVRHFLSELGRRDGRHVDIETEALALLQSYFWPGNVRQLQHVVEGAYRCTEGCRITVSGLGGLKEEPIGYMRLARCGDRQYPRPFSTNLRCWEDDQACWRDGVERQQPERLLFCATCPVLDDFLCHLESADRSSPELFLLRQLQAIAKQGGFHNFEKSEGAFLPLRAYRFRAVENAERSYLNRLICQFGLNTKTLSQHARVGQRQIQKLLKRHNLLRGGVDPSQPTRASRFIPGEL